MQFVRHITESIAAPVPFFESKSLPPFVLRTLLTFVGSVPDGKLVEAVAIPWFEILKLLKRDPTAAYQISPRMWEEIIAGAYERAGFDEVILTPSSGDLGRDVIATKKGAGSIRIFDQVKRYRPGHRVPANDVRAFLHVINSDPTCSKGIVSTTSDFAPRIATDPGIKPFIPSRLELRPRDVLFPWLEQLSRRRE